MPTFNENKPASSDSPSLAPNDLQNNFQAIKDIVEKDHHWDDTPTTDSGYHDRVSFIDQASAAPGVPSSANGILYTESGDLRYENSSGDIQLTSVVPKYTSPQGQTSLPGGLIIKYGSFGSEASGTRTVTFSTSSGFNAFSATPYSIQITAFKAGSVSTVDYYVQTASATSFTIRNVAHSFDYFWVAIGPA